MTQPLRRVFPDVQKALVDDLVKLVGGLDDHTGTVTPADLEQRLPFIRVRRLPGFHDALNDFAPVDIDIFGGSYGEAMDLARQVDAYLTAEGAPPIAVFDKIRNEGGPYELPWDDEGDIRRIGLNYVITSRRRVLL